jgi:hypothetical protein
VNIADPPADELRSKILVGLKAAFDDRDFGRICREFARLHYNGLNPLDAIVEALEWTHDRFEFGYNSRDRRCGGLVAPFAQVR